MRWNLWLAQPGTEYSLATALRIIAAAAALWTLAAAYGLWTTRAALAAAQRSVLSQSDQLSQVARDLPAKRRLALKADELKGSSSQASGSAEITEELAGLARTAGAEVRGVRIGDGGQAAMAAQTGPAAAGPAPSGSLPVADPGHETFECNIRGEYPSLTRFLSGLAASRQLLDITSLQITQGDVKSRPDSPRLEMKISGTVYEAPEKP